MFTNAILLLSLLLLPAAPSLAQTVTPTAAPTAISTDPTSPTELTRAMSIRLQLNEGQYVRLLRINRARLTHQQQIEQATVGNPTARANQLTDLRAQYEQDCGRILTPGQLTLLQQPAGGAPATASSPGGKG